jgi:ABC-type transport system substrate-binding protein
VKEEKMLPMNLRAPMSRRGFLAAGSIGATGLLGASMLPAWAQAKGGTLNYNLESDPPNFDLLSNTTSRVLDSIGGCYNGLVQYDPLQPNRIIGDLAESWEIAADGLSVSFRLRENVRFHDGMPMTSEDVKFTFDITRAPPEGYVSSRQSVLSAVGDIAVAVLFNGDAVLGGMSPPTGSWALDEERLHAIPGFAPRQAPDAIEEARALLAEAGYPDGFSTRLVVRRDDRFGPWGVFLKDQLAKVGIEVNLDPQEAATYTESQRNKDYDLHGGNLSIAFDDPDAIFGNQVLCDVAGNFSQICDAEIDALYLAQSEELDTVRRKALANDLEEKVLGNYLVCPVAFSFRYLGTRKNVHDYLLHAQTNNNRRMGGIWIE